MFVKFLHEGPSAYHAWCSPHVLRPHCCWALAEAWCHRQSSGRGPRIIFSINLTRTCMYVWICMNMYEYVWVCMNMYEYVWICMNMYIYIYAYTCIYVYLHTCIHQFPRISFCWVHIEHCISIVLWCRLFMSRWNYGKPIPPMVLLFGPQTQRNLKCFSGCTERTDFIQWVNPVKEIAWNRWKYVIFAQLYGLFVWCSFY